MSAESPVGISVSVRYSTVTVGSGASVSGNSEGAGLDSVGICTESEGVSADDGVVAILLGELHDASPSNTEDKHNSISSL